MSFSSWMDKQPAVHLYNRILYSAIKQKELLIHSTWTQMYCVKWKKSDSKGLNTVRFLLYDILEKNYRERQQIISCQGLKVDKNWLQREVQFWMLELFFILILVVAQLYTFVRTTVQWKEFISFLVNEKQSLFEIKNTNTSFLTLQISRNLKIWHCQSENSKCGQAWLK